MHEDQIITAIRYESAKRKAWGQFFARFALGMAAVFAASLGYIVTRALLP